MKHRLKSGTDRYLIRIFRKNAVGRDSTLELWKQFMTRRGEIKNRLNSDFISMRVFHRINDEPLTQQTPFDEWAAVEVSDTGVVPNGMKPYVVPGGSYAVFNLQGPASKAPQAMHYIFNEWLPQSEYELDNRPHLAIMDADYRPDDPEAKEEIWIPVSKSS